MLRRLIGEDIELGTSLQAGLGTIRADPAQIEQILMNLAINARDAMPTGGKLVFETRDIDVYETYVGQGVEVTSGPYVMLAVSDTGRGAWISRHLDVGHHQGARDRPRSRGPDSPSRHGRGDAGNERPRARRAASVLPSGDEDPLCFRVHGRRHRPPWGAGGRCGVAGEALQPRESSPRCAARP